MDSEIVDVVTDWEARSYSGGYDGLRELADGEFTGAVTEGTAWLFFLNGRIVGVFDGTLESFAEADGRAHRAPHASLPLLFAMQQTGGETKAQYYTEDTSLSSADDTLSAGSFTGFVELSENVLSGDYYVVYYGGRKLPCAFVGQSRDILTGDEAFDRAADEVGIYEVIDVDVDIVEVPDPEPEPDPDPEPESTTDGDGATGGGDTDGTAETTDTSGAGTAASGDATESAPADDTPAATGTADANAAPRGSPPGESTRASADADERRDATPAGRDDEPTRAGTTGGRAADETTAGTATRERSTTDGGATESSARSGADVPGGASGPVAGPRESAEETEPLAARGGDASTPAAPTAGAAGADEADPDVAAERQWRETRTIPSLDPAKSSTDGKPSDDGRASAETAPSATDRDDEQAAGGRTRTGRGGDEAPRPTESGDRGRNGGGRTRSRERAVTESDGTQRREDTERVASLRDRLSTVETERDEAREELSSVRDELSERTDEVERLREDNERLESQVTELETELESVREELAALEADQPDGDLEVSVPEALSGTNLFVRYGSKSGATLEDAHAETATQTEVADNLVVETHTDFESERAVVDGRSYDEFLEDRIEYNFVQWVVRELLYELQETGTEGQLRDLYDALPKLDRAELHGSVDVVDEAAGVDTERHFDVILRDRMGEPLVVANVTDDRDGIEEPPVAELIEDAREVAELKDSLGCACYVTASFFEPGALEAVTAETGGGLLSRNKRASYVKLARKRGFHLSLIESRDGGFHFTLPEL
ncbi:hypothetical protein RYH80_13570 [Halobaculum sp. MBLA0147]|uniref:DUF7527 domain-containing protein n=1 Tax=Halobaculum sp. MBLA0147 TaxID=3079934 RepID=UPI003525328B